MIKHKKGISPTIYEIKKSIEKAIENPKNFVNGNPGVFLFSDVNQKQTKNGKHYYEAVIMDSKCSEKVRIWEWDQIPVSGAIALADYTFDPNYGFSLEVRSEFFNVEELLEKNPSSIMELLPVADISGNHKRFQIIKKAIKDEFLLSLLSLVFEENEMKEKWNTAPAAVRNHHVRLGGLFEHSVNVAEICIKISELPFLTKLNRDLLAAGALVHDIGKLYAYDTQKKYGFELTDEGKLEDHIGLGLKKIVRIIDKIENFPAEYETALSHIILSHHGMKEWGSPVAPKTLEAVIIHNCDRMEAQIDAFNTLYVSCPGQKWSENSLMLGGSVFLG